MKIINKGLRKRINAILYFCHNVKYPGRTKIYKLLYFFDFMHFKQVARPVTDLEYYTFNYGPVPLKFHNEIKENKLPEELKNCIEISKTEDNLTGKDRYSPIIPKKKANLEVFSKRELRLLKRLAVIFRDTRAEEMMEISHLKNEPWDQTVKSKGMVKKIDFLLALDDEDPIDSETAKERVRISKELKALFP